MKKTVLSLCILTNSLFSLEKPIEAYAQQIDFPIENYQVFQEPGGRSFFLDEAGKGIKDTIRNKKHKVGYGLDKILQKYVKPSQKIIDLGAHIGTYTVAFAKFINRKGRVYAFEPQAKLYKEILMNLRLNKCEENVKVYNLAIGEKKGIAYLEPVINNLEGARCIGKGTECVKVVDLDSFNFKNVGFIKIDVENYEKKVLAGAKKTIFLNRPVIVIEIMGNREQAKRLNIRQRRYRKQVKRTLELWGYDLTEIASFEYLAVPRRTFYSDLLRLWYSLKEKFNPSEKI